MLGLKLNYILAKGVPGVQIKHSQQSLSNDVVVTPPSSCSTVLVPKCYIEIDLNFLKAAVPKQYSIPYDTCLL